MVEIVFFGEAFGGVFGKACGDKNLRACAEQFEAGGVTDLAATARDDGAAFGEIGALMAFGPIDLAAWHTKGVVLGMTGKHGLFASVAVSAMQEADSRCWL